MGSVPKLSPLLPGSCELSGFLFSLWHPNLRIPIVHRKAVDCLNQLVVADEAVAGVHVLPGPPVPHDIFPYFGVYAAAASVSLPYVSDIVEMERRRKPRLAHSTFPVPSHLSPGYGPPVSQEHVVRSFRFTAQSSLQHRYDVIVDGNAFVVPFLGVLRSQSDYSPFQVHLVSGQLPSALHLFGKLLQSRICGHSLFH
jgi:hypothetical protein